MGFIGKEIPGFYPHVSLYLFLNKISIAKSHLLIINSVDYNIQSILKFQCRF
jgi:hypothetical protein